jgi:glycosyltransferase involved in cell wall biosynthesis
MAYYWLSSTTLDAFRQYKPDQVIFFDDVVDPRKKITGRIVLYAHLPYSLRIRYFDRQSGRLRTKILEYFLRNTPEADLILANSSKTSESIKAAWGREAEILYPPVDTASYKPLMKENIVAVLSRFRPYKHIEDCIEAVAISRTKPKLRVIGLKGSATYLETLKKLTRKRGIEKTTAFLENAFPKDVRKTLGQAKIFVHTCRKEPFGIAVVEAMAAGCVPIVYKDWGPWIDIVDKGKYGLGFDSVDDLAERIDEVVADQMRFEKLSRIARDRADSFDEERFRRKIREKLSVS